jgi:hypothetical protein
MHNVSDNIVVGVAVSTFRDQFERVVPKDLQKQIKHPYYFGLYHCLWQILTLERISRGRITLQKPIRFLFDRKKGFESFASGIYYSVKEEFDKRLKWNTGFGDNGFDPKPEKRARDKLSVKRQAWSSGASTRRTRRWRRRDIRKSRSCGQCGRRKAAPEWLTSAANTGSAKRPSTSMDVSLLKTRKDRKV